MSYDSSEGDKITNRLDAFVSLLKGLQDRGPLLENKIADAVENGVAEAIKPLTESVQELNNNKVILLDQTNRSGCLMERKPLLQLNKDWE